MDLDQLLLSTYHLLFYISTGFAFIMLIVQRCTFRFATPKSAQLLTPIMFFPYLANDFTNLYLTHASWKLSPAFSTICIAVFVVLLIPQYDLFHLLKESRSLQHQ